MIDCIIEPRRRDLGGFEVGRVLPYARRRMVGPFIFFDHIGPTVLPAGVPRSIDVRPHPHIGLATITYLFSGEIMHRDSLGSAQPIRPGAVNWMTAGRGITHSERFERARAEGGPLHGVQAWVALPNAHEEIEPSFQHHAADALPTWQQEQATLRLIAGDYGGRCAPVQVLSPLFYLHAELPADSALTIDTHHAERAAYIVDGTVDIDGAEHRAQRMLVFSPNRPVRIVARTPARLLLLGGAPLGERLIEWNFVSSSRARIEQAKTEWRAGRMKLPVGDDQEFIPLPQQSPPPEPMS